MNQTLDEKASIAATKYIDEWMKDQTLIANNTTLVMKTNFIPGFKSGYETAMSEVEAIIQSASYPDGYTMNEYEKSHQMALDFVLQRLKAGK